MATFIIRYLRNLFDVDTTGAVPGDNLTYNGSLWVPGAGGGGGGAPANATYLVGAADATLTNEIVVGATPGGELGNTWASPTVDTVHSGSSHAQTQAAAEATAAAALLAHETDAVDAHDASAISNIPAGTIASTDVQGALNELDGQIATSLSDAVILAPASSARNVIQPTAGAVIAAIVKAHAAQSVDLMQWQDSAGVVLTKLGLTGALTLQPTGDVNSLHLIPPANTGNDSYVPLRIERPGGSAAYNEDLFDVELDGTFWITPPGEGDDYYLSLKGNVRQSRFYTGAITDHALQRIFNWGAVDPDSGKMSFFHGTPVVVQQTAASVGDLWNALIAYGLLDAGSVAPSVGGAPSTATYITQTPDAGLSAEQALSALATGLVKNTTGTGVLSIAVAGTDYASQASVDAKVAKSLYDANTVLAADSDDTPAAVTMGASTILARLAAGNIKAATPAELKTLLAIALDDLTDAAVASPVAGQELSYDGTNFVNVRQPQLIDAFTPTGGLAQTCSRMVLAGVITLTSQRLDLYGIWLPKGLSIASITFMSRAGLVTGVNQLFGIFDDNAGTSSGTARALLRGSADGTNGAWAADTFKTLALTSSYTTTREGLHYLGILVNATTPPTLTAIAQATTAANALTPVVGGTSTTAITALPNPAGAITANARLVYAYVS